MRKKSTKIHDDTPSKQDLANVHQDFVPAPSDLYYDNIYQGLVGTNPQTGNLAGWEPYLGELPEATVKPSRALKYAHPMTWNQVARQHIYSPETNQKTDTRFDMNAFNAVTGGIFNRLSPVQNLRFGYDLLTGDKNAWNGYVYGNNGIVSDAFAQEHPYLSMLYNGIADASAFGSGRTLGVARNLTPLQLRNQLFVARPPVGYDGIRPTLKRVAKGVLSGEKADIDNPWWLNGEYAEKLRNSLSEYTYVPDWVDDAERTAYLKARGDHALKARADAWRLHNRMPQMFDTFVENPRHPGSLTDPSGIKSLKYMPPMGDYSMVDFINSAGGGIGKPKIKILGERGSIFTGDHATFGVTTTSDWFDLQPFSRPADRLIPRLLSAWHKNINMPIYRVSEKLLRVSDGLRYDINGAKLFLDKHKGDPYVENSFDITMFPQAGAKRYVGEAMHSLAKRLNKVAGPPSFKFLKKLDDKLANLEVGDVTGGRPVLMQYDIPWTKKGALVKDPTGSIPYKVQTEFVPEFLSNDILPKEVMDWKFNLDISPKNFIAPLK